MEFKDVKRLLSGKPIMKNVIGYKQKTHDYKEGDTWVEGKKTWTIKNGIKKTVTKNKLRELSKVPMFCPVCNQIMNKQMDKKFYYQFKKCSNCVIMEDTELIISGKMKDKAKQIIDKNKKSWFNDIKEQVIEYANTVETEDNHYITEQGDIEKWKSNGDTSKLKADFLKSLDTLEQELFKEKRDD